MHGLALHCRGLTIDCMHEPVHAIPDVLSIYMYLKRMFKSRVCLYTAVITSQSAETGHVQVAQAVRQGLIPLMAALRGMHMRR